MDASGEVADLMVKESIQLTEESIKLLAAGCKNLTAFLYALAKDNKKLVGKTSMKRLLREGKELKTFCIKAEDLNDFRKYAKPNILFAAIRDTKEDDGVVALVTNTDFVSPVNLFMQRRGYPAPTQTQEDDTVKKDAPRTQQGNSSPERGNGSTPSRTSQMPRALRLMAEYPEPFSACEVGEIMAVLRRGMLPIAYEPLIGSPSRNLRIVGLNIVRQFGIEEAQGYIFFFSSRRRHTR